MRQKTKCDTAYLLQQNVILLISFYILGFSVREKMQLSPWDVKRTLSLFVSFSVVVFESHFAPHYPPRIPSFAEP